MVNNDVIAKDLKHIWHPCSQMKDFERYPPIVVKRAKGSLIETEQGVLIDAISSWWCKSLGHGHPNVIEAIKKQLHRFEHVISANTTHDNAAELGELLAEITGNQHVFFGSDGSSAVEIAMKLALHAQQIKGKPHKTEFIALKNGYHGETFGAMNVSDLGAYKNHYPNHGITCHLISEIPYVHHKKNAGSDQTAMFKPLDKIKDNVCAVILEPLVQGAAGMLCYDTDFLARIASWAKENDIYLIADEIMTGMGRTGTWLACDHAQVKADLICLSKGLTSGSIPLSCVMIDESIYHLFYSETPGRSFLHSHTYSGNPLAISAALATIKTIRDEALFSHVHKISQLMKTSFIELSKLTGKLTRVRGIGAIMAADLITTPTNPLLGKKLAQCALYAGALIRPINNTLYWLPPLNTTEETIAKLTEITLHSINKAYSSTS